MNDEVDPFLDDTEVVSDDPFDVLEPVADDPAPADTGVVVEPVPEVVAEVVPEVTERRIPTDDEIQAAVSSIALGLRVRVRSTNGEVTDTFINGGDYAPGRSRWVQTKAYDSAAAQAAVLAASLQ